MTYTKPIAATAQDLTPAVFATLAAFINQRPGLDRADYGFDANGRRAYASEVRSIAKDKHRAVSALAQAKNFTFDAAVMLDSFRAFSGRLEPVMRDGKVALGYCTGQYFPTEYRKAAAAVLEAYVEAVRPKHNPTPAQRFQTVADLATANHDAGGHWFDRDTKRFFRSRVHPGIYHGQTLIYFVSSEKRGFSDDSGREFNVRAFDPKDASVNGVEGGFRDLSDARAAARDLAKRDKAGEHVKPLTQGEQCGFCGHYGEGCTGTARAKAA